jgi:hypothetical protein
LSLKNKTPPFGWATDVEKANSEQRVCTKGERRKLNQITQLRKSGFEVPTKGRIIES